MDTNNNINLFELQVDNESIIYLRETAKWSKFLAILGFVWCGILLLVGVSVLATRPNSYGAANSTGYVYISIVYMALAVVYFFPCIYTLNFARKMQTALQNNDQLHLNASFKNLRSTLRYLGITSIVGLALLVAGIVFGVFSDLSRL